MVKREIAYSNIKYKIKNNNNYNNIIHEANKKVI